MRVARRIGERSRKPLAMVVVSEEQSGRYPQQIEQSA